MSEQRRGEMHLPLDAFATERLRETTERLAHERPGFVKVRSHEITDSRNLIAVARSDRSGHDALVALAAQGYLHYWSEPGEARLMHRSCVAGHWSAVRDGDVTMSSGGVAYRLSPPKGAQRPRRLLVIFSGISHIYNEPRLWRYFTQNYRHAGGLIPGDCAVLRIADLGGVVGAFYGATVDSPGNEDAVSDLIWEVVAAYGISTESVVLLGSSKGGTGAVRHGLIMGLQFVACDPILGDQYYELEHNDDHFTKGGVFLESKDSVFDRLGGELVSGRAPKSPSFGAFFTAPVSAQYQMVSGFADTLSAAMPVGVFESADRRILGHPTVAPAVLGETLALVNSLFLGWDRPLGRHVL